MHDSAWRREDYQQSEMMKTDAGTASLSVYLLTTSTRLSNHFLLYTPIDFRFQLYQSNRPKVSIASGPLACTCNRSGPLAPSSAGRWTPAYRPALAPRHAVSKRSRQRERQQHNA